MADLMLVGDLEVDGIDGVVFTPAARGVERVLWLPDEPAEGGMAMDGR